MKFKANIYFSLLAILIINKSFAQNIYSNIGNANPQGLTASIPSYLPMTIRDGRGNIIKVIPIKFNKDFILNTSSIEKISESLKADKLEKELDSKKSETILQDERKDIISDPNSEEILENLEEKEKLLSEPYLEKLPMDFSDFDNSVTTLPLDSMGDSPRNGGMVPKAFSF